MEYKDKKLLLTPMNKAHVTGQPYPKDLYYRKRCNGVPDIRFTLCMPDGMVCSIPVFKGESIDKKIKEFVDNWYKVTRENPEKFDHFVIKERCPICGGELIAKIHSSGCSIWCTNYPQCNYQEIGDSFKARELICEKHGLKFERTHKTGSKVIFSSKNIKSKR